MGNLTVKESGEMVNIISPNVSNITSFKVHFSPKQEGSGDPSPDNVREITGWNGVEGYSCGKNLFGGEAFESAVHSSVIFEDAQYGKYLQTYNITSGNSIFTMPFKENTQYTFIGKIRRESTSVITGLKIKYTDGSTTHLFADTSSEANEIVTVRMVSAKNKTIDGLYYLQRTVGCHIFFNDFGIFEGDVPIDNFEPYQGVTTSIDWTEDVGTVYGGYVDLVSGELVQTWQLRQISELGIKKTSGTGIWEHRFDMKYWVTGYGYETSGTFKCLTDCFTLGLADHNNSFLTYVGNLSVYDDTVSTADEFKAKYGQNYVAYEIKSDLWQTYQLTPQQLSTLKGQNNFWSNADYIEIEYELTETFDIQKAKRKIILNQPHVESASGDIVTFDTDMKGKLKECKVYFSPVQEGEGDPSPENVREITGWNGVSVRGLPSEYQEVEYIEKNIDNQYIDTGILGNGELHIDCKINISQINNGAPFFGSYGNSQRCYFLIQNNGNKVGYSYITTTYSSVLLNENNDYHINTIFNSGEQSLFINDELILSTNTTQSLKTNKNIYLFGYNFNGTFDIDRSAIFKLYYFKLYQDGTLVRNFIPCYRKSDNEIGMYDTVSKQFFTNQGTGTFLKGNDVDRIHGSIDWTNDVGTVYGGYVDLVSGELVQTWYKLIFDGVNQKMNRDYTDNQYIRCNQVYFSPIGANGSAIRCNNLPLCIQTTIKTTPCFWSSNNGSKFGGIVLGTKEEYPDLAEATAQQRINYVNDWLKENPTTVVYKLTTPIHYQLTPQQLTALRGANNIYSNTNGQTEIKYWKH